MVDSIFRKWSDIDGVEPLPITRSELIRERLDSWCMALFILVALITLVIVIVTIVRYVPSDVDSVYFLLGFPFGFAIRLIPTYPLVSAWMLRRSGARPLRLTITPTTEMQPYRALVAVRTDQRWRLAWVPSCILDAEVLPTADTVSAVAANRRRFETSRDVSNALRALLALLCVPLLAGPLHLSFAIWGVVLIVALIELLEAVVDEVAHFMDWRLTRGEERPSMRTQREAVLRVRAELTEGTRPATLVDSQVPLLLQPDVEGVPCIREHAVSRAAANLLAAQCLLDAGRLVEAEQVLRYALRVHGIYSAWSYKKELSRLLAIVVLCNGGDLAEAERLRIYGSTGGYDPYDFHVYEALRAHRRGFRRLAPKEAEKAIEKMKRSIYPGQALAYEALLRRTLGLPDIQPADLKAA